MRWKSRSGRSCIWSRWLLLGPGPLAAHLVLAALALVTVVSTVAVPAHNRLAALDRPTGPSGDGDLTTLLRSNMVRTAAWTASAALSATLLFASSLFTSLGTSSRH
jgi:hypothetical protein